jgi:hypothetical protein
MAQTIANFNHVYSFAQLDTYSYTITEAGTHTITAKLASVNPLNNFTVTIKKNGSTISTTTIPASVPQNELNAFIEETCALNDVIAVTVASSNGTDAGPNEFKGTISITRFAG